MTVVTSAAAATETKANDGDAHAANASEPSAEAPSQPARKHEDASPSSDSHQDTTTNALLRNDNANDEKVEVARESEVRDTRISFEVHPQNFDDDALPDDNSDQQQLNALGNASGNATIDVLRLLLFGVR